MLKYVQLLRVGVGYAPPCLAEASVLPHCQGHPAKRLLGEEPLAYRVICCDGTKATGIGAKRRCGQRAHLRGRVLAHYLRI